MKPEGPIYRQVVQGGIRYGSEEADVLYWQPGPMKPEPRHTPICMSCHKPESICACDDEDEAILDILLQQAKAPLLGQLLRQGRQSGAIKPAYHYQG